MKLPQASGILADETLFDAMKLFFVEYNLDNQLISFLISTL